MRRLGVLLLALAMATGVATGVAAAGGRGATADGATSGQAGPSRLAGLQPGESISIEEYEAVAGRAAEPILAPLAVQRAAASGDRIEALGAVLPVVRAPVRHGRVDLPGGVGQVGWLAVSASPGAAAGTTALAYHRDQAGGGRGQHSALYALPNTATGTVITTRWAGESTRWRIDRVQELAPDALPASVTERGGPRRLVLITCGGPLVLRDGALRWSKRALVWATPVV